MFAFGSLFAGIGGFDLGLERAGMTCLWQVEIDAFCQRVLKKHWPDVPKFKDVRNVGKRDLAAVDLIAGGFPCQPHSTAGKRRGAADDRNLWPEYRRIIDEIRPRWVLAENVPGIRTTMLDQVLSDLEGLEYTCGTLVIPACAFAAPHRRVRIWIVAHANGGRLQIQSISIRPGGSLQAPADVGGDCATVAHTSGHGLERQQPDRTTAGQPFRKVSRWRPEPRVGRVADGVPHRVDRVRALGNAVVPQVVEWIGRQIIIADERQ